MHAEFLAFAGSPAIDDDVALAADASIRIDPKAKFSSPQRMLDHRNLLKILVIVRQSEQRRDQAYAKRSQFF